MQKNSLRTIAVCATALAFFCGVSLIGVSARSPQASGYHVVKTVVLGGEGAWDYLYADPATHRVFISRGSHVMVVDADGKLLGDIPDTKGVHGVALAPEFNRGYSSNGQAASVTAFDLKTLATIAEIKIPGQGPDAIIFDPASKRIFTMNGRSQDATAIDAKTGDVVGTVPLGGKPETPSPDGAGHVFVNIEDKSTIVEFDSHTLKVLNTWPLAPCEEPSGQAIDLAHKRLVVGCGNKMMAFVDYTSGKVVSTVPIGQGVDASAFDPSTGYAFSSCGDGTITVAKGDASGKYTVVDTITTAPRARTMTIDTATHMIYTVTAEFGPPPAPAPGAPPAGPGGRGPRPQIIPGSFTLYIFGK